MKTIVPISVFLLVLVPTVSAFATSDDTGPSCSPITGNPYQEECGETKVNDLRNGDCTVRAPEDTETHTPSVPIRMPCS